MKHILSKINFVVLLTLVLAMVFFYFQSTYWVFVSDDYFLQDLKYTAYDTSIESGVSQIRVSRYAPISLPTSTYHRLSRVGDDNTVFNYVEDYTYDAGYVNRTFYLPLACDTGSIIPGDYYWTFYITVTIPNGNTRTIIAETNAFKVS